MWADSVKRRRDANRRRTNRVRRGLCMEGLEQRRLLAAEIFSVPGPGQDTTPAIVSGLVAEGEPAPDLVQFAKNLINVRLFAAAWSQASTEQLQLFEDGAEYLTVQEITGGDRKLNELGMAEEIDLQKLPVWQFGDGTRYEGILTLAEISERSGVEIPTGQTPSFVPIGTQTVAIGSPLHIPIDAYDPNGDELMVTVSVADPDLLEAVVLSGNRSIRIDMEGFGDMVFELFEQRAPRPTGRIIELADADFYDGILFHRVISNFVLQAGDPTATGTSGSELGPFDDQFHPDLQHNRSGVLSFAKTTDDSNNSQFFIVEQPARHLDFNHSVFGQLVEGERVREAISSMQTIDPNGRPSNDRPVIDIPITSIDVFPDTENAVIMLKAKGTQPTTTMVTVRVADAGGLYDEQSFEVVVLPDTANSQPFLLPLGVPSQIYVNQTLEFQLQSVDIEGDPVVYDAARVGGNIGADVVVDPDTGAVTVTPAPDAVGRLIIGTLVAPRPGVIGNAQGDFDRQDFILDVLPIPFHRVENPPDVDGEDGVTARDALLIINAMFAQGGEIDLTDGGPTGLNPMHAYNVNGDLRITALDALQVINALARGETEQTTSVDQRLKPAGWMAMPPGPAKHEDRDDWWSDYLTLQFNF
jgi:cyclophilin family peptidyl-prolyl cis-trans isomerase